MAQLIAQFCFDTSDLYDNDIYDSNKIAKLFRKQFANFLSMNKNLKNVTCIGVNTGYTDRIIESQKALNMLKPAVVFTDEHWNPDLPTKVLDSKIYDMVKGICDYGTCVFKTDNATHLFDCVNNLYFADYCGCCYISNLGNVKWYDIDGEVFMTAYVDCESG